MNVTGFDDRTRRARAGPERVTGHYVRPERVRAVRFKSRPAGTTSRRQVLKGIVAACALALVFPPPTEAYEYRVTPDAYLRTLAVLQPGDRLKLAPGVYRDGLPLRDLHGAPSRPIVIEGPVSGAPAVLLGRERHNTISLRRASHVVIRNLVLDGAGLEVDAVKAESRGGLVHHITLEGLTIVGHGADQGVIAISTKTPAAFWTIRNNVIVGAGTGMYLGDSDGSAPFVAGRIEGNLIVNTLGYNVQIKHQRPRPALDGLPTAPQTTVIRGNFFSKARNASAEKLARPNLLLGHLPLEGPGENDGYVVAENVFFANPVEALLQAEGNVAIARNVFINPAGGAIAIQPHNDVPRRIEITGNFIAAAGEGIRVQGGHPGYAQVVADNRDLGPNAAGAGNAADAFREWLAAIGAPAKRAGGAALRGALDLACGRRRKIDRAAAAGLVPRDHFVCQQL
jgi:hypothetical protein